MKAVKMNRKSVILIAGCISFFAACSDKPVNFKETDETARIFPDYTEVTIPSNIAPLNFKVLDSCEYIYVEFTGNEGSFGISAQNKISISSRQAYHSQLHSFLKSGL